MKVNGGETSFLSLSSFIAAGSASQIVAAMQATAQRRSGLCQYSFQLQAGRRAIWPAESFEILFSQYIQIDRFHIQQESSRDHAGAVLPSSYGTLIGASHTEISSSFRCIPGAAKQIGGKLPVQWNSPP